MSKRPSVQRRQLGLPPVASPGGMRKHPPALPGFPGGPAFDWNKLPNTKDGPPPTEGPLVHDKLVPKGKKHYLSSLAFPRKKIHRLPGDEFALLVGWYNRKFKTELPTNLEAGYWKFQQPGMRAGIARLALKRWEQHMCAAGYGHCPKRGFFSGLGHFLSNAVKVITKIPVLGNIAKIAASPFQMMGAIASGQRLDKAVLGTLKSQVNAVRDLAPYAQMVVSLVPGVGTGIGAALGAAVALSKGRPITEAVMAGIKGALPGGPLAASGFDMAMSIAHGKPVLESALHAARDQLPPVAQKAFDIGLSVAQGRKLQNVIKDAVVSLAPDQVKDMVRSGTKLLNSVPGMAQAASFIKHPKALDGFKFATGLLGHAGINEEHITELRKKLSPIAKQGFDAALDLQKSTIPWLDKVKAPILEADPIALASQDDALPEGAIPIASVGGMSYYMPAHAAYVSGGFYL